MDYKFHRINTVPSKSEPGCVYFENSTKKIKLGEDDGSYVEFGGGSSVQPSPNDVIIDISLIQETEGSVEEEPELVTLLKKYATAANSGASVMPKLFVKETKEVSGATVSFMYPASFNGNVVEVEGQTIIYPGMLSYTKMNPESGNFNVATTFATIIYAANTFVITGIKTIAMSESGSASKVLAENGTWVSLPSIRVDSDLSDTSTNPIQNKAVSLALKEKASTSVASTSSKGLMSSADKVKLEGIEVGANKTEFINFDSRWFDSGTIPADVVAKIKEHELPLLVYNSQYDLRHAGSYLWNGTIICVSCFDSQGDSTRIVSAKYNPDGTRISVNRVAIGKSGDGSKFLSDDGTYKEPSVEVDSVLDEASSNPVQNKAVAKAINDINQDLADLPGIIKTITTCDVVTESNPDRYKITISSIRPIGTTLNAGDFVYIVGLKKLGRISSISGGYAYIRYDEAFSSM